MKFLIVSLVAVVCFNVLSASIICEAVLHPPRKWRFQQRRTEAQHTFRAQAIRVEDVSVLSQDGVLLEGWYFPGFNPATAVLLLHGQSDDRAGMLPYIQLFLHHGYSVLAFDSRAHGSSKGEVASYGIKEAGDVKAWLNWLSQEKQIRDVFGLGESMGAAILLQSLRNEFRFRGVVAESSYSSFREIAYDRLKYYVGESAMIPLLRPVVETAFFYAKWRHGIDLNADSPQASVITTQTPILLIHGLRDTSIPPAHSKEIYQTNPGLIELWEVSDTIHTGAIGRHPKEFEKRVIEFFQKHATQQKSL